MLAEVTTAVAIDLDRRLVEIADSAREATAPGAAPPSGFVPVDPSTSLPAAPALSSADRSDRDVAAMASLGVRRVARARR